ncbi:MAG: AI-2E family transporter [Mojavia pulchra JT2-VF2]|jgi:predicted PurR-regulated permease PerM|uniref:AI-2E family transporter n=1 Tax=Mojavia pulchra JT2-VF2 TaxID=287848 RepID=A0A951UJI7_9NOST|nr:AI-2E family transporter [Mojavia pulchra JT2-VF2]
MTLSTLPKWASTGLAFPLIFLNCWLLYRLATLLQPVTSIVITACLIAFLLDYPIKFLEKRGVSRGWAIALVLLAAMTLTTILFVFLGPLVWQQLNDFAERLPRWIEQATTQLLLLEEQPFLQNLPLDLDQLTVEGANRLSTSLSTATSQVIDFTLSTINSTLNLLITVVLSILLVLNGKPLWNGTLKWLPERWQTQIQDSLQPSFQGYFSGQATLALFLSVAQSISFILLDIPFGLLFGIIIGLASVIPFGGTVAILGVSGLLAVQNVYLGIKVLTVAFVLGQINDNLIAPRLLGNVTGLNPAIVIVVLLIGAKFAGFLGLLLAVPITSFLKKIADALREPIIGH